jgi:hypothetical protein|tara:strand:+ start:2896 stop:3594 length:699 start_codon:yes stop_codon:yes gene_type:complete
LTHLNEYQKFILENRPEEKLPNWAKKGKFHSEGRPEYATSLECLNSTPADLHDGFPPDSYGYDLNVASMNKVIKHESHKFTDEEFVWIEKYKEKSAWIDEVIGNYIGFKFCALKMYYPPDGYIAWHTNWNVPGYNCLFTYSDGSGYWRHMDSSQEEQGSLRPTNDKLVHIQDINGWHCKLGYYGEKQEHNKIMWHSAFGGPRITLGFVVGDPVIWDDIVDEITSAETEQSQQ